MTTWKSLREEGKQVRPEQRLHLSPAIYADGLDKGRLVRVAIANGTCEGRGRERAKGPEHAQIRSQINDRPARRDSRRETRFPPGEAHSYFSRDGFLASGGLSPTIRMATPVTRPDNFCLARVVEDPNFLMGMRMRDHHQLPTVDLAPAAYINIA